VRATAVPGLTPCLVARNAVYLLNLADQLVMFSFDFRVRVARAPSPPLLQSSRQLLEKTSYSIQIHRPLPVDRRCLARATPKDWLQGNTRANTIFSRGINAILDGRSSTSADNR